MASFQINNAPVEFDMEAFMSISHDMGSLARSCKYAVMITTPRGMLINQGNQSQQAIGSGQITRDLAYLCESAELPGRGFENLELRYYGPTFKMPHRSEYMPINVTFLCRNNSAEREFFDDWMELINPTTTYNFNYRDDYASTIRVFTYDEESKPTYSYTLYDAFPILINPQPVTWADDNFLRLVVNITYTKWRREYKDEGLYVPRINNRGVGTSGNTSNPW